MNIKSILLTAILLTGTYNTTHSMASLLALVGDAGVTASIISIAWGKTKLKSNIESLEVFKKSQILQMDNDFGTIRSHIMLLLPLAALATATARFTMQASIGSLPLNLGLMAGAYALRIYLAPANTGLHGKTLDLIDKTKKGL
jgi:hypothetical protein